MSTSVVPSVIDALVTLADASLTTVNVFDGFGVTNDPGDFLMVGITDPEDSIRSLAASATQNQAVMSPTRPRDENGSVFLVALSWNGNGDLKAARDAAFSTVAAVEALVRSDPSLGIAAGGLFVADFGDALDLEQTQSDRGAEALVRFSIRYRARL